MQIGKTQFGALSHKAVKVLPSCDLIAASVALNQFKRHPRRGCPAELVLRGISHVCRPADVV